MTGQYSLTTKHKEILMQIIKEMQIDCDSQYSEVDDDGNRTPIHRDVSIKITSSDDQTEEIKPYLQVD